MDKKQEAEELQVLGFFGIFKESFKIIWSWRKIFSQITLLLIILPNINFLIDMHFSLFFFKFLRKEEEFSDISFCVSKAAYFTYFLILSLFSTFAVVNTIECIYTAKEISFKKIMSGGPMVFKRLQATFIWSFVILLVYHVVAVVVELFLFIVAFSTTTGYAVGVVLLILHLTGFVYLTVVWQLASVVSVFEDVSGIQALTKSKALIKGKMGIAVAIFLLLSICSIVIENFEKLYKKSVVLGLVMPSIDVRIGVGIIWFLFLFKVFLAVFGPVVQTVFYFVCKSYHHQESIDKSSLADHLEVYTWDYVRPDAKEDVQLGEFHV